MLYIDANLPLALLPDMTCWEYMKEPEKSLCGNVTSGVPETLPHM